MKKYIKPDLYYENFELSQHIAACLFDMEDFQDLNTCSVTGKDAGYPDDMKFFASGTGACIDGPLDDICYTNGTTGINLFNS